jgi:hypothetical protein
MKNFFRYFVTNKSITIPAIIASLITLFGTTGAYYFQKQIDQYYWQRQYDTTYREREIDKRLALIDDFMKTSERYIECEHNYDAARLPTPLIGQSDKYYDCTFDGFIGMKSQINQVKIYFGKKIEPDINTFESKFYEENSANYKTQENIDTKVAEFMTARDKLVKDMQNFYNDSPIP